MALVKRSDGYYDEKGRKTNNADGSVYYDKDGYDAHGWKRPDSKGGQTHKSGNYHTTNYGRDDRQFTSHDLADHSNGHVYTDDYYNRDNIGRWNDINKRTSTPDKYGAYYNSAGLSQFVSDPNYVGVDDYWMSDYAPYGRNENGTPYRADGSIMGYGGDGDRWLQHLKEHGRERIGYDPTGQSDKRDYNSTLKPIYAPGFGINGKWGGPGARGESDSGEHSPGRHSHPSFDRGGYDEASNAYNDYLSGNPDHGGSSGHFGGSSRPSGGGFNNPYADLLAQQQAAIKAQRDAAIGRLNTQRGTVAQGYDDIAKAAYAQKMKRGELLRGQNAALASGTADSLELNSNVAYQNELLKNERAKNEALAGIDNAINDIKANGDTSLAEAAEKYALMALQEKQRQAELAEKQRIFDLERQDKLDAMAREEAYRNKALAMRGSGKGDSDDEGLSLKEKQEAAKFFYQMGDEESYKKMMGDINGSLFGSEPAESPKFTMSPGSKFYGPLEYGSTVEDSLSKLYSRYQRGEISEDYYNALKKRYLQQGAGMRFTR